MKIRYGMLMVDGIGKAGGQCVQRRGGTRVLRNISVPTQRMASTQNPQRFVNNKFFTSFAALGETNQAMWQVIGSNTVVRDPFGESRTLSAREAFIKFNAIRYPFANQEVESDEFSYNAPILNVLSVQIDLSNEEMFVDFATPTNLEFIQLKAMKLRSNAVNPSVAKLKTFARSIPVLDASELFLLLRASVQGIYGGNYFSIAVRGVTSSGLVSPWNQFKVMADF